jgi:hypothetical protein
MHIALGLLHKQLNRVLVNGEDRSTAKQPRGDYTPTSRTDFR